jgi:hypothetical protein
LSDPSLLVQPGTPQNKALKWILDDISTMDGEPNPKYLRQRYVMAVLFYATGGDTTWKSNLNFLQPEHTCRWNEQVGDAIMGVQCDPNDPGTIVQLRIADNGLQGMIPVELRHLPSLLSLELADGEIGGIVPPDLGELINLQYLSLRNNRLEGNVFPREIPLGMSRLEYLYLNDNPMLGGDFPREFNQIPTLRTVHIENTSLRGNLDYFFCNGGDGSGGGNGGNGVQSFDEFVSDCATPRVECCCCTYCCDPYRSGGCDSSGLVREPTC